MTYPPNWDFTKKGKSVLEGTYTGQFPNVGRYKNVLFAIKAKDGKTYTIWGTREIKQALSLRPTGKKVRIQFLGKIKDKKHTTGIVHFQINVGKGNEPATLENNRRHGKTARAVAASGTSSRQSSARPLRTVGRGLAAHSAAKLKKRKKITKLVVTGMVDDEIPLPPPEYLAEHAAEEEPPMADYDEDMTAAEIERIRKRAGG